MHCMLQNLLVKSDLTALALTSPVLALVKV